MTKQEMIDALMLEDFSPIYHEADRIRKNTAALIVSTIRYPVTG